MTEQAIRPLRHSDSCRLCGTGRSRRVRCGIFVGPSGRAQKWFKLETELLTGPAEALSITDRAGCAPRHFKI